LVNAGIYNYVRHPAYLGSLLSFLGLALYFGNWISFVVIFFPTLFAILNRIAVEEKVLINHFGREYIDYAKKTKRLIPNIY
jgi:protein-S-isoprenylcysteine O-methyltransferase Ste14